MPKKVMTEKPPFIEQLQIKWDEGKFVCVGLDADYERLPKHIVEASKKLSLQKQDAAILSRVNFMKEVVNVTGDLVCAFKPNIAFFEDAPEGEEALAQIVEHIHERFPDIPVIGDVKRADIGNPNRFYAKMAFERYGFDAITTNSYFGQDTFEPFLQYPGKGLFILCRTTNPGSKELQEMPINLGVAVAGGLISEDEHRKLATDILTVSEMVAFLAANRWSKLGNLGLVVGATHAETFEPVRKLAGDLPFLIPGIGTQGGDLEKTLKYAPDSKGQGMIINSGSSIIFASSGEDFAEAAREATLKLHNQITELRAKHG